MRVSETNVDQKTQNYVKSKISTRNPVIRFDKLKMYFGRPYTIDLDNVDGNFTIYEPTLGNVVDYGEKEWYANLSPYISTTTTFMVQLWDSGIDWNEISDFEFFCKSEMFKQTDPEFNQILFQRDMSKFEPCYRELEDENGEIKKILVLYDEETETEINEEVYYHLSQYLRTCFQSFPNERFCKQEALKKAWIQTERASIRNAEIMRKRNMDSDSTLFPVISACINHPGFPYDIQSIDKLPIFAFMDSVARLQIYESTRAMLTGSYSGMCDMSKVPGENFNFMREIKRD